MNGKYLGSFLDQWTWIHGSLPLLDPKLRKLRTHPSPASDLLGHATAREDKSQALALIEGDLTHFRKCDGLVISWYCPVKESDGNPAVAEEDLHRVTIGRGIPSRESPHNHLNC